MNRVRAKENCKLRFCVDYRNLEVVPIQDSYPIPRLDDCIDSLGDTMIFLTLVANSGYWQVEIAEKDCDKAEITSHHGLSRLDIQFALQNTQETFQRAMNSYSGM